MLKKRLFSSLIWFGAAISIAEIFTGTLFSSLGLKTGIIIILLGHLIGCSLMYLVGKIGTLTGLGTMKSTARSFGKNGSYFFASLNGLQLIGWTGVMIFGGASAANILFPSFSTQYWAIIISVLICAWLLIQFKQLGFFSITVMILLFILSIVISKKVFTNSTAIVSISQGISIPNALELAIAMPLSWLPLIGDYTKDDKNDLKIPFISSLTYFIASSWMYIVGLGCALYAGESNLALILVKAGMGVSGLLIIVLSTVTTTYLDAYSCGVSFNVLKLNEKKVSLFCVFLGLIISLFINQGGLENFLYLISSVFVPMAAIQITDYFIIKKDDSKSNINIPNLIIFSIGFILYRLFLNNQFFLGISLPVMIITSTMVVIYNKFVQKFVLIRDEDNLILNNNQ